MLPVWRVGWWGRHEGVAQRVRDVCAGEALLVCVLPFEGPERFGCVVGDDHEQEVDVGHGGGACLDGAVV